MQAKKLKKKELKLLDKKLSLEFVHDDVVLSDGSSDHDERVMKRKN